MVLRARYLAQVVSGSGSGSRVDYIGAAYQHASRAITSRFCLGASWCVGIAVPGFILADRSTPFL